MLFCYDAPKVSAHISKSVFG